jgi:hypothetical protein
MHAVLIRAGRPLMAAGLALLVAVAPARAQTAAEVAELKRQLERSLQMIDALNARVSQLEKQLKTPAPAAAASAAPVPVAAASAAPAAAAANASTETRLTKVEQAVNQLSAAGARESSENGGIAMHGFADAEAIGVRHARPGEQKGFAIGTVDFYLTPELGPNVKTLVELNIGAADTGEIETDLERLQIGYTFSDALTVWLGRFHTPFGYWNMAFHHGAQIQTTILRPRMLDFEDDGGFLPTHTVGAWATGAQRFGSDRLVYHLWTGNGTQIGGGQLNPRPGGDNDGSKVVGAAMSYRFGGALNGITAGVNGLTQKVHADVGGPVRLRLFGAYALYDDNGWEAVAEGYAFRNTDLGGGTGRHNSTSAYVQLGRSLDDRWMPYVRYEKASLSQSDPYFTALASGRFSSRQVMGLRYNPDARAAIKLEWNRTHERGLAEVPDELRLQYAIGF